MLGIKYSITLIKNIKTNAINNYYNIKNGLLINYDIYSKYILQLIEDIKQKDAIVVYNKKLDIRTYKKTITIINKNLSNILLYSNNIKTKYTPFKFLFTNTKTTPKTTKITQIDRVLSITKTETKTPIKDFTILEPNNRRNLQLSPPLSTLY